MDARTNKNRDYEVGYGKPPKHSQFRKGQSGFPQGRKKRQRVDDLGALLNEILAEEVIVLDRGRKRKMTNLEAMFHAQLVNALNGDKKAILALVKIADSTGMLNPKKAYRSNVRFIEREGDQARILRKYREEMETLTRAALASKPKPA